MSKRPKSARAKAVPAAQERPTLIEMILDETGSMAGCKAETIFGFNAFLAEQRQQPGRCLLTLTKFDTSGPLRTPYVDLDLGMVPDLTPATYLPNDCTNLRDAIGARIEAIAARTADWPVQPHVLILVLTDGGDNASVSFSEARIAAMLTERAAQGWTAVYLGPKGSANAARRLGFLPGNIREYDVGDAREMTATMAAISHGTVAYRATRSDAVAVAQSFFDPNA